VAPPSGRPGRRGHLAGPGHGRPPRRDARPRRELDRRDFEAGGGEAMATATQASPACCARACPRRPFKRRRVAAERQSPRSPRGRSQALWPTERNLAPPPLLSHAARSSALCRSALQGPALSPFWRGVSVPNLEQLEFGRPWPALHAAEGRPGSRRQGMSAPLRTTAPSGLSRECPESAQLRRSNAHPDLSPGSGARSLRNLLARVWRPSGELAQRCTRVLPEAPN
jgi:hypothetical protein